jgi:hypothetical protein
MIQVNAGPAGPAESSGYYALGFSRHCLGCDRGADDRGLGDYA